MDRKWKSESNRYIREISLLLKPGENIPVDGIIIEGNSALNESALTGESIPVDKKEGDAVSAATLNTSGYLKCEATRVGEDTTLSQIIQMVSDAAATKAPIAKVADKVPGIFCPNGYLYCNRNNDHLAACWTEFWICTCKRYFCL